MVTPKIGVDRAAFEKLIEAVIVQFDLDKAVAAIEEMKIAHTGDSDANRIILLAKKRSRGIVDQERAPMTLPVPGHLPGSSLGYPRLTREAKRSLPCL